MAWKLVPEFDRQRMVEAYLSGLSAEKAAALVGRDHKTCIRALKRAGIPLREFQERSFDSRNCRFCNKEFVPTAGGQRICQAPECKRRGATKRNADYVARHPGRKAEKGAGYYRLLSPREKWRRWLLAGYGIGLGYFDAMVLAQGGRCVCGEELRSLHVDHDHKTGRVRGLLCRACNLAAGYLKDCPGRARRLAAYLEEQSSMNGDLCADTTN